MIVEGIIMLALGITFFVLTVIYFDEFGDVFVYLTGTFLVIGFVLIISVTNNKPTEKDVLSGKAIYQETIHITGNDTIKTYQIVWKEENL